MKFFIWNDNLKTGMAEMDRQHQELIKRINSFVEACIQEPRDFDLMKRTFGFLDEYVVEHFQLEESLMLKYEFPLMDNHTHDHNEFRKWVAEASDKISQREFPESLVMEANYRLVEWLQLHIRNRDRNLSQFLQKTAEEKKVPSLLKLIKGDS